MSKLCKLILKISFVFLLMQINIVAQEKQAPSFFTLEDFTYSLQKSLLDPPQSIQAYYQPLLDQIKPAEIVLIGDSTHGTHEFYAHRIKITKKLILEQNYKLITIEGNWPDSTILNKYIQSQISYTELQQLNPFKAYPSWMWKNQEVVNFLHWLRQYNMEHPKQEVHLFGLDIYSYHRSIKWVTDYILNLNVSNKYQLLDSINQHYACLTPFRYPGDYGKAVNQNITRSCQNSVEFVFNLFRDCKVSCDGSDSFFQAQQHAFILINNEKYYRSANTPNSGSQSWNIRDNYMYQTLVNVRQYFKQAKTIVWAHNLHTGDARGTSAVENNQLNIAQLLRQKYKQKVYSIGMFTYTGEVIASNEWGHETIKKSLNPAHKNSVEHLFNQLNTEKFYLIFNQLSSKVKNSLNQQRIERHVGVVYDDANELENHYTGTQIIDEFDAIIFFNQTNALNWLYQW